MFHLSSYSQKSVIEIRLKCKVEVEYSESTSYKKLENVDLLVEVNEFPKRKSIILKSKNENVNNISVNIGPDPVVVKGYIEINSDKTDDDKYEINSNVTTTSNTQSDTSIYLNKKNGEIIVSYDFTSFNGASSQTSISGTCKKIDTLKKKYRKNNY